MGRERVRTRPSAGSSCSAGAWPTCSGAWHAPVCSAQPVFSLASFAGGIAQSAGWLIAARAAQGLGAAMVAPAAPSIITVTFTEGAERNRALGIWVAVAGAGGAAGALLGGILTSGLSWRWVLFVNVPIGLIAALLAPRTLAESRADDGTTTFDLPGAATVTACCRCSSTPSLTPPASAGDRRPRCCVSPARRSC